jgi:hypothetical protein
LLTVQHDAQRDCNKIEIKIAAPDEDGFQLGIGRLARELRVGPGWVHLPRALRIEEDGAALWPLRGHQYTAAHNPSMFRTWDEFDKFTADNAVFGTNQIELAHFDAGNQIVVRDLLNYSTHLHQGGMNVSFWWSLDIFTTNKTATQQAW